MVPHQVQLIALCALTQHNGRLEMANEVIDWAKRHHDRLPKDAIAELVAILTPKTPEE